MGRFGSVTMWLAVALSTVAARVGAATVDGTIAPTAPTATSASTVTTSEAASEVVFRALSLHGVTYRFGGDTVDSGLDCSGLVRLVFHETLGLPLPRRSEEISRLGGAVQAEDLRPGDLVFFNTQRRAFSHVGIYIGNKQFVHAPSSGHSIRIESLAADYWVRRFDGARRLLTPEQLASARASGSPPGPYPPALAPVTAAALPGPAPLAHASGRQARSPSAVTARQARASHRAPATVMARRIPVAPKPLMASAPAPAPRAVGLQPHLAQLYLH